MIGHSGVISRSSSLSKAYSKTPSKTPSKLYRTKMSVIHDSITVQSIQDEMDKRITDIKNLSSKVFADIENLATTMTSDEGRGMINKIINVIPTHGHEGIMMERLSQVSIICKLLAAPCDNTNNSGILYFILNQAIMRLGYGWDREAFIYTHGAQIIASYPNDIYTEADDGWWWDNTAICGNVLESIHRFIKTKYNESKIFNDAYESYYKKYENYFVDYERYLGRSCDGDI